MGLSIVQKGAFQLTHNFLQAMLAEQVTFRDALEYWAQKGTDALAANTPVNTGLAARSWYHKVSSKGNVYSITWYNSDVENGFPVVIMLQYGHGTGGGGYVQGQDFINPTLEPIFAGIADAVWQEVTKYE